MLGEKHKAIVDWLVKKWISDGPRICVIEGFSGVGKTEVASEFERSVQVDARVDAPESGSLDDLMLDLSQQLADRGYGELAGAINSGKAMEGVFESVLLQPVCIVIDEFQRMIDSNNGAPSSRVAALLERISKRAAPGRLLLLSHHSLDKTLRWSERVAFKRLDGLSPTEGAQLLSQLLRDREREQDIPPARRPEISSWLGGNPRAIRVLIGCLEQEALDDLTGVVPEAWEARDQEVSQSLISRLERELLFRALENLDGISALMLWHFAVFRKGVTQEGITHILGSRLSPEHFLTALSSRFLIEQRSGWYSLNPVVREISLHRLKGNVRAIQVAHRSAAGYYTRHFNAKQIVNAGALGGVFIEARYHLVQAEDLAELSAIVQRFGVHLRSLYGWTTPEAQDEARRNELIGVLSAYLQEEGPKAMEYYLARLLYARGGVEDRQRALEHARRSTGKQSRADAWVLRLRLEAEVAGVDAMMKAAKQGFNEVHENANLFALYLIVADKLTLAKRTGEAINLLTIAISKVGPDKGLHTLYLLKADLLTAAGEVNDAIIFLREGLTRIPVEHNLFMIYRRVARLLIFNKKVDEAIGLLRDGISRIPPEYSLVRLYLKLARTLLFHAALREDAILVLEEGLQRIPTGHHWNVLQSALKRILNTTVAVDTPSAAAHLENSLGIMPISPLITAKNQSKTDRLQILSVGTEWDSRHGGLSTFNRDLCVQLALSGHRVVCVVPESSEEEKKAAEKAGVHLVMPAAEPGLEGTEKLLLSASLPDDFTPALVIGHDRKTGPHAKVIAERFGAAFVLFIHTRPEDIEWHKDKLGPDDTATKAESRRELQQQLAASAALVVGVGPNLTIAARTLVYLEDPQPLVHQLDPGFRPVTRPSSPPPEIHCLLLGRAEDSSLKGLDIAARALGEVTRRNKLGLSPRLIVRGAPIGTGQALRQELVKLGYGRLNVEVRDYSPNVERLQKDILMSSLVLMPSRSEGFGLVALEAIAAGTPVLVSDRSGLAAVLKDRLGQSAQSMIVETRDDLEWSAQEWARSIEPVLIDRTAAFARALVQKVELNKALNWKDAIDQLEAAWTPLLPEKS